MNLKCFFTFFLAAALAAAAFGQSTQSPQRNAFSGIVQDSNGDAIPGVHVTLRSGTTVVLSTSTNAQGRFKFPSVASGTYIISAKSTGFNAYSSAFTLGFIPAVPLKIVLSLASMKQTVTVSAGANHVTPDTSNNLNGISENAQNLKNLPVFDEDIIGTLSRFLDTDSEGTGGAAMVVNGVPVENVAVTPSAIKSIKIDNDPFDAEYPRPGWGRMEITTKAGTQQYHGEINFIFRDAIFNARNAFSATRPPEQRRKFEGMLSGPLFHSKKTSFLISADHDVEDLESNVFALTPSGTLEQNVASPTHNTQIYGRIDHTINDKNSFAVTVAYHQNNAINQGVGGLTLPEAGYDETFRREKVRFDETTVFTPNLLNEFHLVVSQFRDSTASISDVPQIDVLGAFTSGGAQTDQLETKHHFALTEMATWSHGKHVLKWGVDIPDWARRGLDDRQNFGGTYTFSSLASYEAGQPLTYTLQQGDGRLAFWQKMVGLFAQDDYRWKPNLMFSAGIRWDWENYFSDPDEFAPRFGFAWSPQKSPKTVIRGGTGIFNDRVSWHSMSSLLLYNGARLQNYIVTNPAYPSPGMIGGVVPPSITELA
ncbi:MAG: TonB-dependent receptor, partial [Terriglobia bacterium]